MNEFTQVLNHSNVDIATRHLLKQAQETFMNEFTQAKNPTAVNFATENSVNLTLKITTKIINVHHLMAKIRS